MMKSDKSDGYAGFPQTMLVTGSAGFIGSNFVTSCPENINIISLDKLTYAGNLRNLDALKDSGRHTFVKGDIGDSALVSQILKEHRPSAIVNFAAESHVDRSISGPEDFITTNIVGTFHLLEAARGYWAGLDAEAKRSFRFLHVSTDEVYGSLDAQDPPFTETTQYQPNSPYAASKAGSDHLARAYHHTYGLPTLTTNCSNNYGPYQFPEKLIPLMINNALGGKKLPVYGDGMNVRDWLYVGDHCAAIRRVLQSGRTGETYNIGGCNEVKNIEVVKTICAILDRLRPQASGKSYAEQISFVPDRPGHDRRYAIDASKVESELGWGPSETFASGMEKTVLWYLSNQDWMNDVTSGSYLQWMRQNYEQRERVTA